MFDFPINSQDKKVLAAIVANPPQGILFTGTKSSGIDKVSQRIGSAILNIEDLINHPYGMLIKSEDKSIGIEEIRKLESFSRLKVPGNSKVDRVIVINDSDKLTIEAQNALLKLLEEPPIGTVFILNSTKPLKLLPTIKSRLQNININKPSKDELRNFYTDVSQTDFERYYSIAGGSSELINSLILGEDKSLTAAAGLARELLSGKTVDRLKKVDEVSKDKATLESLLKILSQMSVISLNNQEGKAAEQWKKILISTYQAEEELSSGGQAKLVTLKLMLNL